ncbi:MAG: hypothetical protein HXL35_05905 [Prevotellaceae bacterium]|nr:hypothetical protein [Prevotellaceae bacterium]
MPVTLYCKAECVAAASNAAGCRHTTRLATVNSTVDGRPTMTKSIQGENP